MNKQIYKKMCVYTCKYYALLYKQKGLEHPLTLVYAGVLELIPLDTKGRLYFQTALQAPWTSTR